MERRPHHLIFEGGVAACARLIPYAKRKLRLLSDRLYADRRFWAWRRKGLDGSEIRLERLGPVEYIYIRAGGGYEFVAVVFGVTGRDAMFTLTVLENPDGVPALVGRRFDGAPIDPLNDGYGAQDSRFLFAGGWKELLSVSNKMIPMLEWFRLPLGSPAEVADWRANGFRKQAATITFPGLGKRYVDCAITEVTWYDGLSTHNVIREVLMKYVSPPILHAGGSSRYLDATALNANYGTSVELGLGMHGAAAALHDDGYLVIASWEGFDYVFAATKDGEGQIAAGTVPSYVTGHQFTRWQFRGDGRYAISIQHGWDGPTEMNTTGPYPTPTYHTHSVEEVELSFDAEGTLTVASTIATGDRSIDGIYPIAADYDLFDQSQRKVGYFEVYAGPALHRGDVLWLRFDPDDGVTVIGSQLVSYYTRSMLVYFVMADMDADGDIGSAIFRTPLVHCPQWWYDVNMPDNSDNTWVAQADIPTVQSAMDAEYGYFALGGAVAALDLRAEAWAVQQVVYADIPCGIAFRKDWGIWGDRRESTWAYCPVGASDGDPFTEASTFAGDPIAALEAAVPSGFAQVNSGMSYWTDLLDAEGGIGTQLFMFYAQGAFVSSFKLRDLFDGQIGATGTPPVSMKSRRYDGFRIHPSKSFSLLVQGAALLLFQAPQMVVRNSYDDEPPEKRWYIDWEYGAGADPEARLSSVFFRIDHIEQVRWDGSAPVATVTTHLDVFNDAHATTYQEGYEGWGEVSGSQQELITIAAQGVWVP